MLNFILKELENHLGLVAIPGKGKREKFHLLEISKEEQVWVTDLDPGIYMTSDIAPFVEYPSEDLFIFLAKANYLGQGTGGAVIALDPDETVLTLSLLISYEINYKTFRDKLEEFFNYLSYWREELKNIDSKSLPR